MAERIQLELFSLQPTERQFSKARPRTKRLRQRHPPVKAIALR
jgi:hypothetical protein